MTISLQGFPGPYRTIPASVRRILTMNFFATERCVDQLAAWASGPGDHPFADWPEAVKAASHQLGEWPGQEGRDGIQRDMIELVRHAGRVVQGLYDLTGAGAHDLNRVQSRVDQDCTALLQVAAQVPVLYRFDITVDNLREFSAKTDLQQFNDWEPPLVELLVHDPFLVAQRPRILPPRSVDGTALQGGSLLVQARNVNQSSATAFLDASVGGQPVKGQLIANSGNNTVVWRHTVPPMSRDDPGTRLTPMQPMADHDYVAFKVSAGRSKAPNTREYDGEKRILDAATSLLMEVCVSRRVGPHEVTGSLRFATSLRMCPSCYLVAAQFLVNFPSMTVDVSCL